MHNTCLRNTVTCKYAFYMIIIKNLLKYYEYYPENNINRDDIKRRLLYALLHCFFFNKIPLFLY